jgi:type II secretory pathway pseudopilin PulG
VVGFALIELLVVVLIISTLLSISIPLYLSTVRHAAARVVQSNLRMIAQAGQTYYVRYGHYPSSISDLVGPGKDVESVSGPQGVTYDIDGSGTAGGSGQGTPGNDDGPGNPDNPVGPSGLVIRATENGTDVFGSSGTTDTATYALSDNTYSGL